MAGVNTVNLIGNLGGDPEIKHLDSGRTIAKFSLAVSEKYKNREGELVSHTEWVNIVMWTPLAELAEKYLTKGSQVYISGKLTTRSYDDKEGNKKYVTEVVGRDMTFLGGKQADKPAELPKAAMPANSTPEPAGEIDESELPF